MKITTFIDDEKGDAGGYADRTSVSVYLTPGEAHDLRVSLEDLLATKLPHDPGWHTHVRAWDGSCEIVLLPDREGAQGDARGQGDATEQLSSWLDEIAASGGSVIVAVNAVAEVHQVDLARAKELLREHPAWRDRL